MAEVYRCPVDGCTKEYGTAVGLRGHMAGAMQYDEAHQWENHEITHNDLEPATVEVPGMDDY